MFTFSLTLIRHGETQYNREKLLQGQGVDTPLSETGLQQGEAVGQYLKDITFNNVFASNLQRAVQTAEIILRNNTHCSGMEMVLEPLLRERGFGIAEGRPKEDLKNMANAAGQSCRDYTPPGGETLDQVKLRFKKFLKVLFKRMLDEHGSSGPDDSTGASPSGDAANETAAAASDVTSGGLADDGLQGLSVHALVVSHGAYIRVAIRHLVEDLKCSLPPGVKMSHLFSPCPNTGISRFILTLSQSESGPVLSAARCVFTNRKDHLENLTAVE
ncbi:fructose-2,6-bisphosphatase TIGAR [Seriola lalandi dorsalis]|uniref:fructose-2,6-bisphosphate 2-phosphatase n=1 Tax=Seriola lalandi dorsalis TaxID=1841481 RepID=A0A3B4YI01_SERLL|nr:fructose-2,6-bisphosphatase TIGAR B-like [Seriola dumerili]XP_023268889.1 fructose-2,6-bisphosphatase TIGAR [Seriola lalandi dorsalis]XP_056223551.1 fructose-2,6-bisphosphatase TIGAR B [Seriola aureovittata]